MTRKKKMDYKKEFIFCASFTLSDKHCVEKYVWKKNKKNPTIVNDLIKFEKLPFCDFEYLRAIKNGQSRETGNIGHTRHRMKTNKT